MKITVPGILIALGIIFAIPFITMIVDVWTWIMFGSGISPIEWEYSRTSGFQDTVSKPIVALFMLVPAGICLMLADDIASSRKRNIP